MFFQTLQRFTRHLRSISLKLGSIYTKEVVFTLMFIGLQSISTPVFSESRCVMGVSVSDVGIGSSICQDINVRNSLITLSIKKWVTVYGVVWYDGFPWYWMESQIRAESGYGVGGSYNPHAVSPVGAKGLGQFMPNTWKEVVEELGIENDVYNPFLNIQGSVHYMYKLRAVYATERPDREKHSMALCSYNAGLGNCIKAQKLCNNTLLWTEAKVCLPQVTGHHSEETIGYVDRIWSYVLKHENKQEVGGLYGVVKTN